MKKFAAPTMEVEKLEVEDVISTSTCPNHNPCGNDMGDF